MTHLARTVIIASLGLLLLAGCETAAPPPASNDANDSGAERVPEPVANAVPPANETAPSTVVEPFPGVHVRPAESAVEIDALVCLDAGWLEQVACSPNTREHEALVVVAARPSHVHAALLMIGAEPGAPGRWTFTNDVLEFVEPRGTPLDVLVRYEGEQGPREHPVREWIRDHLGRHEFPDDPWVFAGSRFADDGAGGERYVADDSGSLIGLVTFGDEVVGFSQVLADDAQVQAPEWEVDTRRIPPIGTPVTVVLRPR